MGVYDEYEPTPELDCPWCGSPIPSAWQGKDGPCGFFFWRQGERHPVDQRIDGDARIEVERYRDFTLPNEFSLVGACPNGHYVRAIGRCVEGVWETVDLSESRQHVEEAAERERVRKFRGY